MKVVAGADFSSKISRFWGCVYSKGTLGNHAVLCIGRLLGGRSYKFSSQEKKLREVWMLTLL